MVRASIAVSSFYSLLASVIGMRKCLIRTKSLSAGGLLYSKAALADSKSKSRKFTDGFEIVNISFISCSGGGASNFSLKNVKLYWLLLDTNAEGDKLYGICLIDSGYRPSPGAPAEESVPIVWPPWLST